jgi:hypothetical protein
MKSRRQLFSALTMLLLLAARMPSYSQDEAVRIGVRPFNAVWITSPEIEPRAQAVLRFRRPFRDTLDPWRAMLAQGLTTWAENPEPTRSDSHAWSAHPNFDFLTIIAGITPAAPDLSAVGNRAPPRLVEEGQRQLSIRSRGHSRGLRPHG